MDENEIKTNFSFEPEEENAVTWEAPVDVDLEAEEETEKEVSVEEVRVEPEQEIAPFPKTDYDSVSNEDFDFDAAVTEQITAQIEAFYSARDAQEQKTSGDSPMPAAPKPVKKTSSEQSPKARKEEIQKKRATRKASETQKKKRMRRLLFFGAIFLIAFVIGITALVDLVRVLVRGRTYNIGPLPREEVVIHTVPVYYDYTLPVFESSPVQDSYFSDALFLGDTRVQCLDLYGVGNFKTLLYGTSINVSNALSYDCKSSDGTDGTPNDKVLLNNYGKIYLNFGINELGWPNSDSFATNYRLLVEELKAKCPDSVIYICNIMPISRLRDGKNQYVTNDRIKSYNILLQTVAEDTKTYYLNCYESIVDEEGFLPAELNSDGINLYEEGCQIWYNYLKSHTVNPEDYSN